MKKKKKSLLWQLEHPTSAGPSFLLGTMHVRDEQAFYFLDRAVQSLQQCEALASEYNLSEQPAPHLASVMLLPEGQLLSDFFRPSQYQKLRAILYKAFGVRVDQYARFMPLMLINIISEQLLQKDRPLALDLQLWEQAGAMGKTRLGIETLDEQLAVLQQIPLNYQIQLLRSLAGNVSRFRKAILKNTGIYQDADPQRLYQMVRRSSHGLRQLLLFQRNRIMADRIEQIVHEQPTLCAVGAGHLAGKEGLIRLLKKQGFRLSPILMTNSPGM